MVCCVQCHTHVITLATCHNLSSLYLIHRKKFIEQCSQFSLEYDLFDTGGCEFEKQLEAELQSVKEERQKTLKGNPRLRAPATK